MSPKAFFHEVGCTIRVGGAVCVAVAMLVGSADGAYTLDRWYQMGDDIKLSGTSSGENAANGQPVGSGTFATGVNGAPVTYDSAVEPGNEGPTFEPLEAFGATGLPTYVQYGVGANPASPVPAVGAMNQFGIMFDGIDDYLRAVNLNDPSVAAPLANKTYPNTNNRGMQLWVYPTNVPAVRQVVIDDADFHAFNISAAGNWNPEIRETLQDSGVSAASAVNQWTHLEMVHDDFKRGGVISYINGIAVTSQTTGYANTSALNLVVGANSENDPNNAGITSNPADLTIPGWYAGIVDEIEMFVLDDTDTSAYGTFDYTRDNGYFTDVWLPMQSGYSFVVNPVTGHNSDLWVKGDINFDGAFNAGDIEAFKDGWLSSRADLPGAGPQAGDYTTLMLGDLDLDGDTDLGDWILLRQYNSSSLAGLTIPSLSQLNHPVPEPGSLMLAGAAGIVGLLFRRRRQTSSLNN